MNTTSIRKMMMALAICMAMVMTMTACSDSISDGDGGVPSLILPQRIAVIDAGSTGSRLKVYEVKADSTILRLFPTTADEKTLSKGGALSDVANQADSVRKYLEQMTSKYTHDAIGETIPLYVLATAGMRYEEQDKTAGVYSKMASITEKLNGFKVQKAMTISGRYEGLYAWIAANYENHSLKASPVGTLEMGGKSMQVAFATTSAAVPADCKITRNDWGTLYCKSYLHGGIDAVYEATPDTMPFVFTLPVEDISAYCGNTSFFGCSTGVLKVLNGIAQYGSKEAYANTLPRSDRYHNFMCAYYLPWVIEKLNIDNRITADPYDTDWTEGAIYDIVINKQDPESFDYKTGL